MTIQGADQATIQRCKQQVTWTAESQASLADLECHVDDSTDRAAAGKVTCQLIHSKVIVSQTRHPPRCVVRSNCCIGASKDFRQHEHCDMHMHRGLLWYLRMMGRPEKSTSPESLQGSAATFCWQHAMLRPWRVPACRSC